MNVLRQLLFAVILMTGFALTASAQQNPNEGRKKPPKENVEIKPEENKKPKNNENNNNNNNNNRENRGKKPQTYFLISENRVEITSL